MISSWHRKAQIPDSYEVALHKVIRAIQQGDNVKEACRRIYDISNGSKLYKTLVKDPEVRTAMKERAFKNKIAKCDLLIKDVMR